MNNNDIVPGFDEMRDDSMEIILQKIDEVPGCLILYLTGYVDTYNANYFHKRVAKVIGSGFTRLIFHLAGFNMVSDTIIGSFTAFLKAVKSRGGDLVLTEIHPKVYEVFQLLGYSQFFNIKEKLDEAVGFFSQKGEEAKADLFPKIFKCPICGKKLKAVQTRHFCCYVCGTLLEIDDAGHVLIAPDYPLRIPERLPLLISLWMGMRDWWKQHKGLMLNMWPFRSREKIQGELIKKGFSKYIDVNQIDSIIHNKGLMELSVKYIDFILVLVRDESKQYQNIREALDIIQKYDCMIQSITSMLITVYFGVPFEQPDSKQMRIELVRELSESLGPNLAIIHGRCLCPVGNVGNEHRMAYTALLPEYKSKLSQLTSMEFGQIMEI